MNQNIRPLTATTLMLLFGLLLAGKFWAHNEALSVRSFSYMHAHPDGTAYITLGNQLFGFDQAGKSTKQIDLQRLGADENVMTDYAFFSNGDILFRRHTSKHSISTNLDILFRLPNLESNITEDKRFGLFRCSLQQFSCQPFTKVPLNLDDVFALTIDVKTDRVFIADTSRHSVYLYSSRGEALDAKTDFYFPNQLAFENNQLYVADTNHHNLVVMQTNGNKFGAVTETIATGRNAKESRNTWPSGFLLLPNELWINNAGDDMGFGDIDVFNHQGAFIKRLQLPDLADPFDMLRLGKQVLVSDFSQDRIYRLNLNGDYLDDFKPAVIQALVDSLHAQRLKYKQLENGFTGMFVLALVLGFTAAFYKQFKLSAAATIPASLIPQNVDLKSPNIHWLIKKRKRKWILIPVCMMMILQIVFLIQTDQKSYALVYILMILITVAMFKRKIGVASNFLIVDSFIGKPQVFHKKSLIYSNMHLFNGSRFLRYNTFQNIFPPEELVQHFYPFIRQGRFIENSEMQTLLLKDKRHLLMLLFVAIGMIGYFVYLSLRPA